MKSSFFKSIRFTDTRDYWFRRAGEKGGFDFVHSGVATEDLEGEEVSICFSGDKLNIFFKPPFVDKKDNLYIPFEIVGDPEDSVVYNVAFITREEMFNWKADSLEQLLVLPGSLLPEVFDLEFGYVLRQDSLNPCYQFLSNLVGLI